MPMPKEPEWVTLNKNALEELLKAGEKDPATKTLVATIRSLMNRGGGRHSTWIDPLPRSMEG